VIEQDLEVHARNHATEVVPMGEPGDVMTASACPAPPVDDPLRGLILRLFALGLRPASSLPLALLVGACIPVAWVTGGPSFCPFKVLTGLPCPDN